MDIFLILQRAGGEGKLTKQEAYKSLRCWHCVYRDSDSGECLCGEPEDENCPKYPEKTEE